MIAAGRDLACPSPSARIALPMPADAAPTELTPASATHGWLKFLRPRRRGIGLRLLALILLFSSAVTLVATAVQLYFDYRLDVDAIERRMDEIQASNLGSLAASLWSLDLPQLKLQLEGIQRLPDMQALELREIAGAARQPVLVAVGKRAEGAAIAREFPLVYADRGQLRPIGVLYAEATLAEVYRRLFQRAAVILVDQGVKTFLVSSFILYIVFRLVTRHLIDIARFLGTYDPRSPRATLGLQRRPLAAADELDRVVTAFNDLLGTVARQRADLAAQEARSRSIVEALAEGVVIVGPDGRIASCNARAETLLGLTAGELVGSSLAERRTTALLPDGSPLTDADSPTLKALQTGAPQLGVLLGVRRPDESLRWLSVNAVPRFDEGGDRPSLVLLSFEDITELRATQEQLVQAQKMESIGRLTGGVAHDFNNLLSIISGNLELLEEQLGERDDLRDLARRALYATNRGAVLTKSLLSFARKQPLDPAVIDMRSIVEEIVPVLGRTLGEAIAVEVACGDTLSPCDADAAQLQTAVLNLVLNARDAMRSGGKLTIEMSDAWLDEDYAAANSEVSAGPYVLLAVSDTGIGMGPEVLSRAFEPFFTTKRVGEGSGLGLSMVYGFAKQSGGHVKIYSEPGHGTTVKLYLPRSAEGQSAAPSSHLSGAPPGGGETILVVEDDAGVRHAVTALLRSLGYRALDAATAPAALETLRGATGIELLLTDVILPGEMNGRQLAERAIAERPGLKVLYMSGYTENVIFHERRLDRGVDLIQKPIQKRDLAARVRGILDKREA
jgi:PAS domain S-box-containing protein